MEFIIGNKYNQDEYKRYNPCVAIAKTSQYVVLEDNEGDIIHRTHEDFQAHFTPVMQYPPCSLEDAEVGDKVELWKGHIYPVVGITETAVILGCDSGEIHWNKDGTYFNGDYKKDDDYNARYLHKAKPETKAITPDHVIGMIQKIEERLKKLENQ
ncbi:MAG: hypothetical protein KGJ13_02020 [Patescibacteria group bacterium]|nr:hypothetical protein [Patescibacteria group bacterium]